MTDALAEALTAWRLAAIAGDAEDLEHARAVLRQAERAAAVPLNEDEP